MNIYFLCVSSQEEESNQPFLNFMVRQLKKSLLLEVRAYNCDMQDDLIF